MGVPVELFSQDSVSYELDVRPLLSTKCFRCHNTGTTKGGVNLDNYKERDRVIKDGQFWLKVLDQIKTGAMPPKSESKLSENDYHKLVNGITNASGVPQRSQRRWLETHRCPQRPQQLARILIGSGGRKI